MGFGSPGDYLILDTDYENYAALFGCEEENGGPTAAVLTREDHPDSLFVSCIKTRHTVTLEYFNITQNFKKKSALWF